MGTRRIIAKAHVTASKRFLAPPYNPLHAPALADRKTNGPKRTAGEEHATESESIEPRTHGYRERSVETGGRDSFEGGL